MTTTQLRHAESAARGNAQTTANAPTPLTGAAIFEGTSYPSTWDDYIGQERAKEQLLAACTDAIARDKALDHVMIATGFHGVGKTALARLVAYHLGVGFVEVQGKITEEQGRAILNGMQDNDVLFWDEIHLAVSGGKSNVEWLLPVLQDNVMITARGVEQLPKITVIAATTDSHKLPETILSRFMIHPVIEPYTVEQGAKIAAVKAKSVFGGSLPTPNFTTCVDVAMASNCNPRAIGKVLTQLRIAAVAGYTVPDADGTYDLDKALEWSGLTEDGLDDLAQRYLCVLLKVFQGQAGERTIAAALNEPTPPKYTEKMLVQKEFLLVTARGRMLTDAGVTRAVELLTERGEVA